MPKTPRIRRRLLPPIALALVCLQPPPASAYVPAGRTVRLSSGTADSLTPSVSAGGRFVAFQSYASDIVPGDTNGASDIFVADRVAGTVQRVSLSSTGIPANYHSYQPQISADGRYVVFNSLASNLVAGDYNGHVDVFVRDRDLGRTERVSVSSSGAEGHWDSGGGDGYTGPFFYGRPAISDDGNVVAFWSFARELDPIDPNYNRDAYVHDRRTATTRLVSVSSSGTPGAGGEVISISLSGDGNVVVFASDYGNLVPGDTNGKVDIFTHDLRTGATERVNVGTDGSQGNANSWSEAISYDGRFVAFGSAASNLVPDDFNNAQYMDIFVRDRVTRTTERVSVARDGSEGESHSFRPEITDDGRFVAFESYNPDIAEGDHNGISDVFVHDRWTGSTQLVSVTDDLRQGTGDTVVNSISPDGSVIAFISDSNDFIPETGKDWDVFVRELGPRNGIGDLKVESSGGAVTVSGWARFSGVSIARAKDARDDGMLAGADVGADLADIDIAARPEHGDVLVRLGVTRLQRAGTTGHRGVVYGLAFETGGVPYEVRANRLGVTASPPTIENGYGLYRCDTRPCAAVSALTGSIGTAGEVVSVAIPVQFLGGEGIEISGARAFTGTGEMATGVAHELDAVPVGAVDAVPRHSLTLEARDAGGRLARATEVVPDGGLFTARLDDLDPGEYAITARACVVQACGERTETVTVS